MNLGRGGLVDEAALVDALRRGHLGGAATDVVEGEPLRIRSPLWRAPNLLITPHVTPRLDDRDERAFAILLANVERWLADEPLANVVGPDDVYTGPSMANAPRPGRALPAPRPAVPVSRVGLVGCGRWGALVHRDLEALGADVTVVDPAVDGALDDVDRLPGSTGWSSPRPPRPTPRWCGRLLDRSVPIFCEKPFTTDVAEARALVERAGDRIHLMHVWRYHPGVERLGELARSGALGAVRGVRSTRVNGPESPPGHGPGLDPRAPRPDRRHRGPGPRPVPPGRAGRRGRRPGAGALGTVRGRPVAGRRGVDPPRREASRDPGPRRRGRGRAGRGRRGVGAGGAGERVEEHPVARDPALRRELAAFLDHLDGGPPPKSDAAEGLAVVEAVQALRDLAGLT